MTLNGYFISRKSYVHFRLVPKSLKLDDLKIIILNGQNARCRRKDAAEYRLARCSE